MEIQVHGDQARDAYLADGADGRPVLMVRTGLLSGRAFTALVLALAPVAATVASEVAKGQQYLQHAG